MHGLSALTTAEANQVMQATAEAIKSDVPNVNAADARETMYQVATIAQYKWNSPLPSGPALVQKIRSSPEYQKMIQRIKTTGTIYADVQERALSPYFQEGGASGGGVMDQVSSVIGRVPKWAWIAGAAAVALIVLMPRGRRR